MLFVSICVPDGWKSDLQETKLFFSMLTVLALTWNTTPENSKKRAFLDYQKNYKAFSVFFFYTRN